MTEFPVIKDPDILNGTPVFRGTRVPVQNLVDYLTTGETIDRFLEDFPTVTRDQVTAFLQLSGVLLANYENPHFGEVVVIHEKPES